jgi:hypothetical protein
MTNHLTADHPCARGDRLGEVARELREEMAFILEPPCLLLDGERRGVPVSPAPSWPGCCGELPRRAREAAWPRWESAV